MPVSAKKTRQNKNLERFRAKWIPVRVKKTRQNKRLEPRSDSIGTEKALVLFEYPFGNQALQLVHVVDVHLHAAGHHNVAGLLIGFAGAQPLGLDRRDMIA